MNLWRIPPSDISSEKNATDLSWPTATFSAMLATKADLPTEGGPRGRSGSKAEARRHRPGREPRVGSTSFSSPLIRFSSR